MSNIDFSKIKTAEQKQLDAEHQAQEQINREARDYLAQTDWYITRQHETGVPVPDDVLEQRQVARDRVVNLPSQDIQPS